VIGIGRFILVHKLEIQGNIRHTEIREDSASNNHKKEDAVPANVLKQNDKSNFNNFI
jgi:hypothetical protein